MPICYKYFVIIKPFIYLLSHTQNSNTMKKPTKAQLFADIKNQPFAHGPLLDALQDVETLHELRSELKHQDDKINFLLSQAPDRNGARWYLGNRSYLSDASLKTRLSQIQSARKYMGY